jgi:hypothetical protein
MSDERRVQVESLPAKGLARALSAVALSACALTVLTQMIELAGFHSKAIMHLQIGLCLGMAASYVPYTLARRRLLPKLSFYERVMRARGIQYLTQARAPKWLRQLNAALAYYWMGSFVVFFCLELLSKGPSQSELWHDAWVSSFVVAGYSTVATVLMSYTRSERSFRADEILALPGIDELINRSAEIPTRRREGIKPV